MPEFVLPEGENEEPISILVKMVKDGLVDPWNIDIADLTDKFLTELEARREMNLRVSGLTIFYLSVLLRLKAEVLDEPVPEEEEELPYEEYEDDEDGGRAFGQIEMLDREIDRRIKRKDVRKRHTNLYELIKQLRLAEKSERRRQRRQKLIDSEDELFAPDTEEVVGIAHDENYEELAEQIYEFVARNPEAHDTGVSLLEICAAFHWPIYLVYLPCLFLVQSGRVDMEQEELFGDLWVVLNSAPVAGAADAQ
ncbi:MAG TPA: segregation/condensation protein A [Methanocorpusculum sp.]|nr:segregation/condensation protein A [Methanocorpusculum sp.]